MGPFNWDGRPYFSWKKLATFFAHHSSFHSGVAHFSIFPAIQKITAPFVGPLFCGAPVRPNMLNIPKSAAAKRVEVRNVWHRGNAPTSSRELGFSLSHNTPFSNSVTRSLGVHTPNFFTVSQWTEFFTLLNSLCRDLRSFGMHQNGFRPNAPWRGHESRCSPDAIIQ